jgi:general secretion pathway protein F
MKKYKAVVVDTQGKKHVIRRDAINRDLLEESLNNEGFFIVSISDHIHKTSFFSSTTLKKPFVLDFVYNIHSLLAFGLDINEAFSILSDLFDKPDEASFIRNVHDQLGKGIRLSDAIRSAPGNELFDDFFFAMVSAGEASGNLTDAFRLINDYLKHMKKIRNQTVSAIIYPIILLAIGFIALQLLLFFILPNFKQIFTNMQFEPTGLIKVIFAVSDFLKAHWIGYIITLFALAIGLIIYSRTAVAARINRKIIQKAPLLSTLYRLQTKIKVTFSLETLLRNGATLEEALHEMVTLSRNPEDKKAYADALSSLKNGNPIRDAVRHIPVYTTRDQRILEISDATSRTIEGFEKIHNDAAEQFTLKLEQLLKLIEPAIIIFIAMFVFLFMYLVISPTLFMMDKLQ